MATSNETQGQATKSDSKDFVEHLRTVHFTLVTVCLALVVILQFPSPVSIREAIRQLNTVTEAKRVWQGEWVDEGVLKELSYTPHSSCLNPVTSDFSFVNSGMRLHLHFSNENWTLRTSSRIPINRGYTIDERYYYLKRATISAPRHLDDFKNMWNESYLIVCPSRLADEFVMSFFDGKHTIEPLNRDAVSSNIKTIDVSLIDEGVSHKLNGLHQDQKEESEGLFYSAGLLISIPSRSFHVDRNTPTRLDIPVLHSNVLPFDFRDVLIKHLPQNHWLHGDFKDTFYELDQATAGFQDLDFEHLKSILQNNEKNAKETFQAFGVTFPIETTTRWGILVILSIQLYLWMHLSEFRRQHFAKSAFAWIGTYSNFIPRSIFSLTVVIIPVGVITYILFFQNETPLHRHIYSDGTLLITCLLAGLAEREHNKVIKSLTLTNP